MRDMRPHTIYAERCGTQKSKMTAGYYKTKESVEEYIKLAKDVNGGELIEKLKKFLPPKVGFI